MHTQVDIIVLWPDHQASMAATQPSKKMTECLPRLRSATDGPLAAMKLDHSQNACDKICLEILPVLIISEV